MARTGPPLVTVRSSAFRSITKPTGPKGAPTDFPLRDVTPFEVDGRWTSTLSFFELSRARQRRSSVHCRLTVPYRNGDRKPKQEITAKAQRNSLDLIAELNQRHLDSHPGRLGAGSAHRIL